MRSAFMWLFLFLHHWSCLNQFSFSENNALILDFINPSSFVFLISSSPNILSSSHASCCFSAPRFNMCKKFSSPCLSLVKILLFVCLQRVICQAQHDKEILHQIKTRVSYNLAEWLKPFEKQKKWMPITLISILLNKFVLWKRSRTLFRNLACQSWYVRYL